MYRIKVSKLKTSEVDIHRYNLSVYILSKQGEILESITPYQQYIHRKN